MSRRRLKVPIDHMSNAARAGDREGRSNRPFFSSTPSLCFRRTTSVDLRCDVGACGHQIANQWGEVDPASASYCTRIMAMPEMAESMEDALR
jgi:hypothetical protein